MDLLGSSFFSVTEPPTLTRGEVGDRPVIVWLQGEHDLSTDEALCRTLARAIAIGSSGLVIDLSEVDFIAVSTLRVIVRAHQLLLHQSRSLTVRSPSPCVKRVIHAFGLDDLLSPSPEETNAISLRDGEANALGSWVAVPVARRDDGRAAPSPRVPEPVPIRVAEPVPVRAVPTVDLAAQGASFERPGGNA
jgi:anti-anti-sigma factor